MTKTLVLAGFPGCPSARGNAQIVAVEWIPHGPQSPGGTVARMNAGPATTLLAIGEAGASLTVVARRQAPRSPVEPGFDTEITVDAFPFGGTLETTFTMTDLREWSERLSGLTAGTGRVVLGGDRAAELVVEAELQVGGDPDLRSICVNVTPSGDDPYPALRYLIFDVPPSWSEIGSRLEALY